MDSNLHWKHVWKSSLIWFKEMYNKTTAFPFFSERGGKSEKIGGERPLGVNSHNWMCKRDSNLSKYGGREELNVMHFYLPKITYICVWKEDWKSSGKYKKEGRGCMKHSLFYIFLEKRNLNWPPPAFVILMREESVVYLLREPDAIYSISAKEWGTLWQRQSS